jgi:hypothetical protein
MRRYPKTMVSVGRYGHAFSEPGREGDFCKGQVAAGKPDRQKLVVCCLPPESFASPERSVNKQQTRFAHKHHESHMTTPDFPRWRTASQASRILPPALGLRPGRHCECWNTT